MSTKPTGSASTTPTPSSKTRATRSISNTNATSGLRSPWEVSFSSPRPPPRLPPSPRGLFSVDRPVPPPPRVLLRVRMLYYLRQEVIGDQAEKVLAGAMAR